MKNGEQPAYPQPIFDGAIRKLILEQGGDLYGFSKREAFAMAAMQGIMARNDWNTPEKVGNPLSDTIRVTIANASVKMADALLKALETPKP